MPRFLVGPCNQMSPSPISQFAANRLEALRGVAAVVVAVFHSLIIVEGSPSAQNWIPEWIFVFNGRAAVTLFFVLSGFVLGLSLMRRSGPLRSAYPGFALRRIMRIYPALLVSTALVLLLLWLGPNRPLTTPSVFVNTYFPTEISYLDVLANLLLLRHDLNSVTWTLTMEMLGSLLLPLLWAASCKFAPSTFLLLPACLVATWLYPESISIAVIPAFLLGFATMYTSRIWGYSSPSTTRTYLGAVCGILLLILSKPVVELYSLPFSFSYFPEAVGAALVIGSIAYGVQSSAWRCLDARMLRWVGKISYSYYLLHPLALMGLSIAFLEGILIASNYEHPILCSLVLWIGSSAIAFPLAYVIYRVVEKPAIRFSKVLSDGL
jgi:peptidoglycan/LPS O-acetylase OafA/YrhL